MGCVRRLIGTCSETLGWQRMPLAHAASQGSRYTAKAPAEVGRRLEGAIVGSGEWIRTTDTGLMSPLLYP